MLSRVAERLYWLGRYLERCENSARLAGVNAQLTLDLPIAAAVVWRSLIDVIDAQEPFLETHTEANERNVLRFMLADKRNVGSLVNSVLYARENVRATREVLPNEAWEVITELYHFVNDNINDGIGRQNRHEFIDFVISYCQQFTGMMMGTMSHTEAYLFTQVGRNLERADMTTRIIDVGARELFTRSDRLPEVHDNILWTTVLRSLSAYQMYRQHVRDRVNGADVVEFVLKNAAFPRAVFHCLQAIDNGFAGLPQNEEPQRLLAHLKRVVRECKVAKLLPDDLHEFIDTMQVDLAEVHDIVARTWFGRDVEVPTASD